MDSMGVIVCIKSINDLTKITNDTKYINISIDNCDVEVINYFLLHGQEYSYSDITITKQGFIYASYECFKEAEEKINSILNNMPSNLNTLEKVRYIYISLGRILSRDINVMENKNDTISFGNISLINNIWGSLSKGKVTDKSISKLFIYLCSRVGIKSELIVSSFNGNLANKVYLDNSFLIADLFRDIYNIQGGFSTLYFDKFNNDIDMDKRVGYIKDNYINYYLDKGLKDIDYTSEDIVYRILSLTEKIVDINRIGTVELGEIYKNIFSKYCPNYDIKINNFYVINGNFKDHFIGIIYNDKIYSFNYSKNRFMSVTNDDFISNLKNNKIGIYDDEDFSFKEKGLVL